ADGSTRDRTVTTTSANGLSIATQTDSTGRGVFDQIRTDVTVLNIDGSRTETVTDLHADGTVKGRTIMTTTRNGLSVTTQADSTGHGIDRTRTDVTVLNADGSKTETVTDLAGNGAIVDRTMRTTSASGLSVTTEADPAGNGNTTT